jgi:hypothetical protein
MGNKNTGKREEKKKPQPKVKAAPGRKREDFSKATTRIAPEATGRN